MKNKSVVGKLVRVLYGCGILFLLVGLVLSVFSFPALAQDKPPAEQNEPPADPSGGNGAIWTTYANCGNPEQNVNHYAIGDTVYINGANFDPGTVPWTITGQPGGASCDPRTVVASGDVTIDASGAFCFGAYQVAADDCGEYTVDVVGASKNDNYRVVVTAATNIDIEIALNTVDCDSAELTVTLTNIGDVDAENVVAEIQVVGSFWTGFNPSSQSYLTLAQGASVSFVEIVGIDWTGAVTGDFFEITGAVRASYGGGDLYTDADSAVVSYPGACFPGLWMAITGGGEACYPGFTVTLTNTGDADFSNLIIRLSYTAGTGYVNPYADMLWNVAALPAGGHAEYNLNVPFNAAWLAAPPGTEIELTASIDSSIPAFAVVPISASAFNPGGCMPEGPVLDVNLVLTGVDCERAEFTAEVCNLGQSSAEDVLVEYMVTLDADDVAGTPSPLTADVGDLASNTCMQGLEVTLPVDWSAAPVNASTELTAGVTASNANPDSASVSARNPGSCIPPELKVTLSGEEKFTCLDEECVTFDLAVENLPEDAKIVFTTGAALAPAVVAEPQTTHIELKLGEAVEISEDGSYEIMVCSTWHGIDDGKSWAEFEISGSANLLDEGQAPEEVGSATSLIYYDPARIRDCSALQDLSVGAMCYEQAPDEWSMRWMVNNPNPYAVDFTWKFENEPMHAATAAASSSYDLAVKDLGSYTVTIFWGNDQSLTRKVFLSLDDCAGAPPPPPAAPPAEPIPVTAVQPPLVEAELLIPVTGINLAELGQGFFRNLAFLFGLAFLGMGFIFNGIKQRFGR